MVEATSLSELQMEDIVARKASHSGWTTAFDVPVKGRTGKFVFDLVLTHPDRETLYIEVKKGPVLEASALMEMAGEVKGRVLLVHQVPLSSKLRFKLNQAGVHAVTLDRLEFPGEVKSLTWHAEPVIEPNVVHALWILDSSGVPLFNRLYSPCEIDPLLYTSFISALVNFQLVTEGKQLSEVTLGNLKLCSLADAGLVFLAVVEKDSVPTSLLYAFRDLFFKRVGRELRLPHDIAGPLPFADEFTRQVDKLVAYVPRKEPLPVRVAPLAKLLAKDSPLRRALRSRFGPASVDVVILSDGSRTPREIAEITGLSFAKVEEILAHGKRERLVQ
jgi:hypothetical protein